jgi:hypothetical protein
MITQPAWQWQIGDFDIGCGVDLYDTPNQIVPPNPIARRALFT